MSTGQINLESEASREVIANTIMAAIKTNNGRRGWVLDLSTLDGRSKLDTPIYEKTEEQNARETWVCEICGKSTFEVEDDYIGSGTNHLGCEFEDEKRVNKDRRTDDRREKSGADIAKALGHMDEDGEFITKDYGFGSNEETVDVKVLKKAQETWLQKDDDDLIIGIANVDKLSEEIVTDNDSGYIYESPDGGETVYKRKVGSDKRELVKDWEKKKQGEKVE
jgi:hypothetical protein